MLNIIAIADDDSLVGHIEPDAEVDILISLGDLYDVTLQKAIDLYAPEHVIAIRGNHCVADEFAVPTIDLHLKTIYFFQTSLSFANDESYGSVYKFILSKSVILNEYEDFATTLAVYSLIVTIYVICCYKRKS
jgi:hypothetical protein